MTNDLRTIEEAAKALRVSRRTVYRLFRERRLRKTKIRGSSFVRDSEIERFKVAAERSTRVA